MMKILHKLIYSFIWIEILACAYRVFALYNDYTRHVDLYATYSAPWYSQIVVTVILTAVMVLITTIIYFIVGYIIKKHQNN